VRSAQIRIITLFGASGNRKYVYYINFALSCAILFNARETFARLAYYGEMGPPSPALPPSGKSAPDRGRGLAAFSVGQKCARQGKGVGCFLRWAKVRPTGEGGWLLPPLGKSASDGGRELAACSVGQKCARQGKGVGAPSPVRVFCERRASGVGWG
jgi:hypothetical protein